MTAPVLCSSIAIAAGLLYATGKRPLLKLGRGIVYIRASGYMIQEWFEGAKSRNNRWRECVRRAASEL